MNVVTIIHMLSDLSSFFYFKCFTSKGTICLSMIFFRISHLFHESQEYIFPAKLCFEVSGTLEYNHTS